MAKVTPPSLSQKELSHALAELRDFPSNWLDAARNR
jgi:hypothetical protein